MSKLSDYSKFDHLDSDSEDDSEQQQQQQQQQAKQQQAKQQQQHIHPQQQQQKENQQHQQVDPSIGSVSGTTTSTTTTSGGGRMIPAGGHGDSNSTTNRRYIFEYHGHKIYEWEQSLDEVIIYVPTPPNQKITAKDLRCSIQPKQLQLGLVHQPPNQNVLNHALGGIIVPSESTWSLEDDDDGAKVVILYLSKSAKGQVWSTALIHNDIIENNNANVELDEFSKQKVQQELMLERFQQENPGMDFRNAQFNGSAPDPRTFMGGIKYD